MDFARGGGVPTEHGARIAAMRNPLLSPLPLGVLLVAAAAAPGPKQPPPTPPPLTGYEHVEVRLAQFDVVVRDKAGKLVRGLGPKDFSVVEDGRPLEIVAVDEWGAEEPPQSAPAAPSVEGHAGTAPSGPPTTTEAPSRREPREPEKRSVMIVFDALENTTALRMSQAKRAAERFVRKHIKPTDVAAVYQLDLSLRPLSGLTSDPSELERAIEKVAWMPASDLSEGITESVVGGTMTPTAPYAKERLQNQATNVASELDWRRGHVYQSLTDIASVFQALPGRRILVLASAGFPMTTTTDINLQTGGFTPKFRDLIRSLAAYGVTVYTLDIGTDESFGDAGKEVDWRVAVGNIGLQESVLTDLGLDTSMTSGSATARRQFLGVLAAESGGRMLTATDLNRDFDTIQEESTNFYRIACRVPVTSASGRYRKTVVTVKRAGLKVTGRRGRYSDIVPLDRPRKSEPTSVDSLANYRPLTVRGVAVPLPTADPKKVPVAVVLEALGPVDIPADPSGKGALDLEFHLVARAAGEIVARYDRSFTAKVAPAHLDAVRRGFRVEGRLDLVPGIYTLQGTVRLAGPPQLATWTATVPVPPPPKGAAPVFTGVFLSADSSKTAPLLTHMNLAAEADALALKEGLRILPATGPEFPESDPVVALFWLKGVPTSPDGTPHVTLGIHLKDAKGEAVSAPTKLLLFAPEPTGGFRGLAGLDLSKVPPGTYSLELTASPEDASAPPAHVATPLIVEAPASDPAAAVSSSSASP